jgi:hypothetical protein
MRKLLPSFSGARGHQDTQSFITINVIVAGADLRLAEGSASEQPSMLPCSIKRCQFPRVSAYALTIKS